MTTFHENDGNVAQVFALLLYEKNGKDVQTLNEMRYLIATTTDKAASMLPPTEDAFKQHVLRAKFQIRIWCNSHIANQEETQAVGHGLSACADGGITPTMFSKPSAPVEVRDLTHLYCKDKDCSNGRKCPCQIAGLNCIDACSCTECQNQNNTPAGQDENEIDTETQVQILGTVTNRG